MMTVQEVTARVACKTEQIRRKNSAARAFLQAHYKHARTYNLSVDEALVTVPGHTDDGVATVPPTLTWLTPRGLTGDGAELMLGHAPIARKNWSFNSDTRTVSFSQGTGAKHVSGTLHLLDLGVTLKGFIQVGARTFQITGELAPISYDCTYAEGAVDKVGTNKVQLRWNTDSAEWKDAPWSAQPTFRFTYSIVRQGMYGGQTVFFVKVSFEDRSNPNDIKTWTPPGVDLGNYVAYATPSFYFDFTTFSDVPPSTSPLFPYIFNAQMAPDAQTFAGAILTREDDLDGIAYGLKGRFGGIATGVYAIERDGKTTGFLTAVDGEVAIDGVLAPNFRNANGELCWSGLSPRQQAATGLPDAGSVSLSPSGQIGRDKGRTLALRRTSADDAFRLVAKVSPGRGLGAMAEQLESEQLSIAELMHFSQFGQPDGKTWTDIVRDHATKDTFDILLYYMNDELREKFVSLHKPDLDPTIKGIAAMKGPDGQDPADFYASLGVAYVASNQGKYSSSSAAKSLNWKRAAAWLNNQIRDAGVMHVQTPALYANRYAEVNPVDKYLVDQRTNSARYNGALVDEIDSWIAETVALAPGQPEVQEQIRKDMEVLKATTFDQRTYWAYVMCRVFISPNFLTFMQAIGISPDQGSDASAFARRLQETAALLSVLDPSGVFAKKFVDIIEAFDLASIIPTLLDYSGDPDDYVPAIEAVLRKFVEEYENNPAPGMKEAAEAIQKALEQHQVAELLDIFANTMAGAVGSQAFEAAIARFNNKVVTLLGEGASMVVTGLMAASISLTIVNLIIGKTKWSDLTPAEQAEFVISAAAFAAMMITKFYVRGVSVAVLWQPGEKWLTNFSAFFKWSLKSNAQAAMADGVRGWLVGGNDLAGEIQGLQMNLLFAETAQEEAEIEASIAWRRSVAKYLGSNLDEFFATRLGAVLALAGAAFAIYGLVTSKNPFEIAANSLFLAASVADFFVAVGSWAIAAGMTEIGGLALAAVIPWLSVFAVAALVIGAVLLIVLLFVLKPKDPLEVFAEGPAKDAGFYMPHNFAIDYLEVYQPEGQVQRLGVSFSLASSPGTYLTFEEDGTLAWGALDYAAQTVFYLKVDAYGRAGILAPLQTADGKIAARILGVDQATRRLIAKKPDVETATDPYFLWSAPALSGASKDGDNDEAGTFAFANAGLETGGQSLRYLGASTNSPDLSPIPIPWQVAMEPIKILGITMADIRLQTNYKEQVFAPHFLNTCSGPFTWTISPGLPSFMQFDPGTGKISQLPYVAPTVTPKTTYTLSVTNPIGQAQTTFTFEVVEPAITRAPVAPAQKVRLSGPVAAVPA